MLATLRKYLMSQAEAHGAAQIIGRGTQFVERSASREAPKLLDHGAQSVARSVARLASQVLGRCAWPLPAAPLIVRRST